LARWAEKLNVFFHHQNTKFTMGKERDCHISFLDIVIYRRPDGCLGYKVYNGHTHTYLNSVTQEHPLKNMP
jgi:hypothetical protein